jgi:hypothetical protein
MSYHPTAPLSLPEACAHLVEVIAQKPAPIATGHNMVHSERDARRAQVRRMLAKIPPRPSLIALLCGVSTRSVQYWARGQHYPRPRNWRRLFALYAVLRMAEMQGRRHVA